MSVNQLPENMGKKIVEALKKQALLEEENFENQNNQFSLNEEKIVIPEDSVIKEENTFQEIKEAEDTSYMSQMSINVRPMQGINEKPMQFAMPNQVQHSNEAMFGGRTPELPTNVAVLKKLIFQLPAGVSKQVGAQIIRQTIEALGISMNSVLQEAQQVQESLNNSVTDCTIKIQEYKNQIMQLESNTREYQRQMAQINDLISLFILTDNK